MHDDNINELIAILKEEKNLGKFYDLILANCARGKCWLFSFFQFIVLNGHFFVFSLEMIWMEILNSTPAMETREIVYI